MFDNKSDDPRLSHRAALLHIADLNRKLADVNKELVEESQLSWKQAKAYQDQLAEANQELAKLRQLEGTVKRLIEEMITG